MKFVLISFILNSFRNLLRSVVCSWRGHAKMPKCLSAGLVFAPPRVPTPSQSNPPPPSLRLPALENVQRVVALLDSPPPPNFFFGPPSVWLPDTIPYVATLFLKTLRVLVKIKGVFIPLVKMFNIVCFMCLCHVRKNVLSQTKKLKFTLQM